MKKIILFIGMILLLFPSSYAQASDKDFVIKDNVLVKYTGDGGDVVVPDGVEKIGRIVFWNKNITSIVLPDSLKEIGESAFRYSNITNITLPDNLEKIGKDAFFGCKSLINVKMSESLKEIGERAFGGSGITCLTLPDGLKKIDSYAFLGCNSLVQVNMPDSVEQIGNSAFEGCSSLTVPPISGGLTTLEYRVFEGCTGFTNINIPENIQYIESMAFGNCTNLTNVMLPLSSIDICSSAFYNTPWMTELEAASVEHENMVIINGALVKANNCTSAVLVIPENVNMICAGAFSGNKNLTTIVIPDTVTHIGRGAFAGSNLRYIEISGNVTELEDTFQQCMYLEYVGLPNGLETIGRGTFEDCSNLKTIQIPNTVKTIGDYAFLDSGISEITFPKSVQSIGKQAVAQCANLTKVTIKNRKAKVNDLTNYSISGQKVGIMSMFGTTFVGGEGYTSLLPKSALPITICGYRYSTAEELAVYLMPLSDKKITFEAIDRNAKSNKLEKAKVTKSVVISKKKSGTVKVTLPKEWKAVKKFTKKSGQVKVTYKSSDVNLVKVNSKGKVTYNTNQFISTHNTKPVYVYTILTLPNGNRKVLTTKITLK